MVVCHGGSALLAATHRPNGRASTPCSGWLHNILPIVRAIRVISGLVLGRQFYDLSAPEDPPFGSIAAMIAAWTFLSCAVTAAVSDNRRCRVS
jgi:hypothetical protein